MFTIARAARAPLGTIQIDSTFPPSDVLENLRARGREWRESALPQDLRGSAQTLDVKIESGRFEMHWIGGGNPFFKPYASARSSRMAMEAGYAPDSSSPRES
ncbi:MAG: hypothetical protein NVSMB53_03130 [Gemmatimonadaceae bacterium]